MFYEHVNNNGQKMSRFVITNAKQNVIYTRTFLFTKIAANRTNLFFFQFVFVRILFYNVYMASNYEYLSETRLHMSSTIFILLRIALRNMCEHRAHSSFVFCLPITCSGKKEKNAHKSCMCD